ncbi:SDR family oxidoreductase [Mycobacterium stomatepiae]|uniref:SDR family oxidoreductase n=1 Tax=Mycobacterium stomatepiae TaxID=470076 RepID=UPI0021F350DA|nr:SDR family oxidoreductase [Mycobacterium stomatepiae]
MTSSTAGLNSLCPRFSIRSHGFAGPHRGRHTDVGLMRYYATSLAEKNIRVNSVHPTGVATPMLMNAAFEQFIEEFPEATSALHAILPVGCRNHRQVGRPPISRAAPRKSCCPAHPASCSR